MVLVPAAAAAVLLLLRPPPLRRGAAPPADRPAHLHHPHRHRQALHRVLQQQQQQQLLLLPQGRLCPRQVAALVLVVQAHLAAADHQPPMQMHQGEELPWHRARRCHLPPRLLHLLVRCCRLQHQLPPRCRCHHHRHCCCCCSHRQSSSYCCPVCHREAHHPSALQLAHQHLGAGAAC